MDVIISIPRTPPLRSGSNLLKADTYGLATHATSAVLTPEVETAVKASAILAKVGKLESITKMNGAKVKERPKDPKENILSRLKVAVSGPIYIASSFGVAAVWVVDVAEGIEDVPGEFVSRADFVTNSARRVEAEKKDLRADAILHCE